MLLSPRFLLSSLVCCVLGISSGFAQSIDSVQWQSNLALAQAQAEKMNKPVLLHFYADWCGPCKQMEASVFQTAQFKNLLGTEIVGVKINGDYHADLVSRFGIKAYPADVFLSPEGKELKRSLGRLSLESYVSLLEEAAAPYQVADSTKPATELDPQNASTPVAKTSLKIKRETLGLKGYSPVALVTDSSWVKGLPQYQESFEGLTFHFANPDEQAKFKEQPQSFLPMYLGCDPVSLKETGKPALGSIQYGAVYQGRIYFMGSEEHQQVFLESPQSYAELHYQVSLDDDPQLVQTEPKPAETPSM